MSRMRHLQLGSWLILMVLLAACSKDKAIDEPAKLTPFAATLRAQSQNYSLNGVDWEGTGAEAAGQALRQHQGWLNGLANFYDSVSAQAAQLAEAHDRWAPQHPTVQEIEQAEQEREEARASGDRVRWKVAQDRYHQLFMKSEEVREGYKKDVAGVAAQTPPPPPASWRRVFGKCSSHAS